MTKSLFYLMTVGLAGVFNISMTACSVDYDGNDCDDSELIGTWEAVSSQYYSDEEGYSLPGPGDGYWVITDRTITEYDRANMVVKNTAGYSFDGRKLNIDGRKACEVVTLSQQQMLLRTKVRDGRYQELTFRKLKTKKKC